MLAELLLAFELRSSAISLPYRNMPEESPYSRSVSLNERKLLAIREEEEFSLAPRYRMLGKSFGYNPRNVFENLSSKERLSRKVYFPRKILD